MPREEIFKEIYAGVAQLVEHIIRNDGAGGSIPLASLIGIK